MARDSQADLPNELRRRTVSTALKVTTLLVAMTGSAAANDLVAGP